jgi:hypothetical protein
MSAQDIELQGRKMKLVNELLHEDRKFATLIPAEKYAPMDFTIHPESILHELIDGIYVPVTDKDLTYVILTLIQADLDFARDMMP